MGPTSVPALLASLYLYARASIMPSMGCLGDGSIPAIQGKRVAIQWAAAIQIHFNFQHQDLEIYFGSREAPERMGRAGPSELARAAIEEVSVMSGMFNY